VTDPLADPAAIGVARIGDVPVVRAPDGVGLADQLLPLLDDARAGRPEATMTPPL
jgi:hypothetical protein